MVILGMSTGNFQLSLLSTGLSVGVGGANVRWRYIPKALKMVTEL